MVKVAETNISYRNAMVTTEQKKKIVEDLVEKLGKANGVYLVDFGGMTVAETIKFRRTLKEKGVEMKVAKNTLLKRALDSIEGLDIPEDKYFGPSAFVLGYEDPTAPAKLIKESFDKNEKPALKAALVEGQYFDGSRLKEVATMPSRADMIASIIGSIHAPISGIVGSINAVMRDLSSVIEEVAKKQNAA